ncbi:MAG: hypothetical protein HZB80_04770 [Deltaproteobacteria bacterium]|nr:hypothetical protein [Deltaproteobacteria bacterium]
MKRLKQWVEKAKTLFNWIFVGEKQDKPLQLTFKEAEKFVKIIAAMFIAIGGIWYAHFKTLPAPGKLSNYDIMISALLLGLVLYELRCFYLYGLLLLNEKNEFLLKNIAHMRAAFLRAWPLFFLIAFIAAFVEKLFPADKFKELSWSIGIIMLVVFIGVGIILRNFLANNSIRPARAVLPEVLLILSYLLALGFLVILLKIVVPTI